MAWLGQPVLIEELLFKAQHGIVDQYSTEGRARSLYASSDDRLIVSEPFSDVLSVWHEIPERTAVTVRRGGVLDERPFRVPTLSVR
jgi:predicted glutamine amidotransferase